MATSTTPQPYTAGRPENSTTSVDANVVRSVLFTGTAFYSGFDNQGTDLASPFRPQASARGLC